MAYDQRSYQLPTRPQAAPSQPRHQQYPQDYTHSNGQYSQQQGYGVQDYGSQGYGAQDYGAQEYAAQDYGTLSPYAQDAGNPYGNEHQGGNINGRGISHAAQDHHQAYPSQASQAYDRQQPRQQDTRPYAQGQQYGYAETQNGRKGYTQQTSQQTGHAGYAHNEQQESHGGYTQYDQQDGRGRYAHNEQADSRRGYAQQDQQSSRGGHTQSNQQGSRGEYSQYEQDPHGQQQYQQSTGYAQGINQSRSQDRHERHPQNPTGRQDYATRHPYAQSRPQTADSVAYSAPLKQPQVQEERRYDPRYQQRHGQSQPVNNLQQNGSYNGQHSRHAPDQRQAAASRSLPQSQSAPVLPTPSEPKKLTMEEWKAQEKAKMHKDASAEKILPQDNAFPTFPTKKLEPGRGGGQSAMSTRSGEDHTRPGTATSLHPDARPGLLRSNSSQPDMTDSARPSLDHKGYGFESARPSMDSQYRPERIGSPLHRTQTPPQQQQQQQQVTRPARTDSYNTTQASPARSAKGLMPSIDTQGHGVPSQQQPLDPISPSNARPSTSDSNRYPRRPSEQPMSPLGKFAESAQEPVTVGQSTAKPIHQHNPQQSVLSEVYNGYLEKRDTVASGTSQKSLTRDEEIEAEMPDFDSAASSQADVMKKRRQTIDQHLGPTATEAPPVPAMPNDRNGTSSNKFDFGFAQQQQQQQQQGYAQQKYQPAAALDKPVQPYANETYERRSMDDTRQGQQTLVNGRPPPQRFYGNMPPPPRPEYDRQGTTSSDPGLQRVGSAPPGRPATQQTLRPADPDSRSQSMPGNPDALPAHPTPVRAGLIGGGPAAVTPRPAPVRNYGNTPQAPTPAPAAASGEQPKTTITHAELQQLRAQVEANPQSMRVALQYAKALVQASKVLANDGGRADPKIAAKNRERYIMDAYKRVKKLVSAGYPDAQFYLADCYGEGSLGLEVDPKEAFKLYQAAAKAGHGTAAYRTAVCCEIGAEDGGGTSRDYPRAVQWYRRAAALGETAAMFKVGMISLKGLLGQPRNLGEATTWLKRAAERADKENPHALHELAVLYETANSTPDLRQKVIPDDTYALSLYKQAADLGARNSQFRMGQAYEYGQLGLPVDHRASIAWYSKAAAQGEHQAELALSGWYLTGAPGILEHSDTEAYLWARKAARAEPPLAKAMFAMGYFCETGIGCVPNIEEAKRWYGRAASYKHPKALERLEAIKRGVKGGYKAMPANKKIARKDQKHDEAECAVM